jgi:hypothetical protein
MSKTNNNWPAPSMMIVSGNWGPMPTFKLIPITKDCPYVECIFNPQAKALAVIGAIIKDTFHMVPRLDDNGEPQKRKGPGSDKNPEKQQRVTLSTFQEYYVHGEEEITNFLEKFAVNEKEYEYKDFMNMPTMDDPNKAGILEGPNAGGDQKSPLILKP